MNTNSLFYRSWLTAYVLLTVVLSTFLSPAQAQTELAYERELFTIVEQSSEFVGGMKAYESFMKAKVRQLASGDSTPTLAEFDVNSDNSK